MHHNDVPSDGVSSRRCAPVQLTLGAEDVYRPIILCADRLSLLLNVCGCILVHFCMLSAACHGRDACARVFCWLSVVTGRTSSRQPSRAATQRKTMYMAYTAISTRPGDVMRALRWFLRTRNS